METETCPDCGQQIPLDDWTDHEKGRDATRLDCPHQDLEKIVAAREPRRWDFGVFPDEW